MPSKPDSSLNNSLLLLFFEQGHCGQYKWQGQAAAGAFLFEAGICYWRGQRAYA
jgi:hypothetical protein